MRSPWLQVSWPVHIEAGLSWGFFMDWHVSQAQSYVQEDKTPFNEQQVNDTFHSENIHRGKRFSFIHVMDNSFADSQGGTATNQVGYDGHCDGFVE